MKRVTPARRRQLLEDAQRLAEAQAPVFRLQRRTRKGEPLTGFKAFAVTGERHRTNLLAKGARPVLASSAWRAIYEEVGLA